MTNKGSLIEGIRSAFRDEVKDEYVRKERIQRAMEGLSVLYSLEMDNLPSLTVRLSSISSSSRVPVSIPPANSPRVDFQNVSFKFSSRDWLESVEWLPHVSEMEDSSVNSSHIPVFPLSGPVFLNTQCNTKTTLDNDNDDVNDDSQSKGKSVLPLFSQFSDVPVAGMEIPLRIFEPRYRQMYQDLLSSSHPTDGSKTTPSARRFIVPFAHPRRAGQFAAYGWLYEIVRVQDVADETNGRFQLVCHHVVTKPVKIHSIVNPTDFFTKFTYLRARADIIEEELDTQGNDVRGSAGNLQPLEELLRKLQRQVESSWSSNLATVAESDRILIDRLLTALGEGSIWSVVHVWVSNLQMQILQLQVQIAAKIQMQAQEEASKRQEDHTSSSTERPTDEKTKNQAEKVEGVKMTDEMIIRAQEPHKEDLESMLLEVSTLVPMLLQEGSLQAQCLRMCQRIRERYYREGTPALKSSTL